MEADLHTTVIKKEIERYRFHIKNKELKATVSALVDDDFFQQNSLIAQILVLVKLLGLSSS